MNPRGFTLIELLVVLVILSGAAALVAPRLGSSWDQLRLRAAARSLAAVLRYARTQAITTKQQVAVKLDPDQQSYQISFEEDHGGKKAGPSHRGEGEASEGQERRERVVFMPMGVRLKGAWEKDGEEPREEIRFFPRGSSSGGRILLVSAEGKRLWVMVDPFGGRPEIVSPQEEE